MISVFEKEAEDVVKSVIPIWTEMRVRKQSFSQNAATVETDAIMMAGDTSLVICVGEKEFLECDYFPIYLEQTDPLADPVKDWFTLARKGGTSEFERSVQWLFEPLKLHLLVKQEWIEESIKPGARRFDYEFYGGVELINPSADKSLRVEVDDRGAYVVRATFVGL